MSGRGGSPPNAAADARAREHGAAPGHPEGILSLSLSLSLSIYIYIHIIHIERERDESTKLHQDIQKAAPQITLILVIVMIIIIMMIMTIVNDSNN